jgi:predicted small lipoprotein YifL
MQTNLWLKYPVCIRSKTAAFSLLLTVCCILASCGKKGDLTLKAYEKPDPPSALKAIHRESEIIVSWEFPAEKASTIKGFHLMKSSGGDFEKIAVLTGAARVYHDIHFQNGLPYQYKIITENAKGIFSNDSPIVQMVPVTVPPPPGNLSFTIDSDTITLSWTGAGEGLSYNVYRSENKGVYSLVPANSTPVRGTSFSDTFFMHKVVYYTVRSSTGSGIRDEGAPSEEMKIDPSAFIPPALEGLQAVPSKDRVYLLWKEPKETWITGYRIYRQMNTKDPFLLIGESRTPSFIDTDSTSQKRNYRVTAMGPAREGPPAEVKNIFYKPR